MKRNVSVFILALAVSVIGAFQTVVYIVRTPEHAVYPLVHNYEQDYYWYLSLMRQGKEGMVLLTTRYTPEQFTPQPINTFFSAAGFFFGSFGVPLPVAYTILRIIGGASLLVGAWILARRMFPDIRERYAAIILVVAGTPFWRFSGESVKLWGEFWTGLDPIMRIAWLPHHTLSIGGLIVGLFLFLQGRRKDSMALTGLAGLVISFAGLLNPASIITGAGAMIFGVLTYRKQWQRNFRHLFLFLILPVLTMLFLYRMQFTVFPWTAFAGWEAHTMYDVNIFTYLLALGIPGFLSVAGLPILLRKGDFNDRMLVGWFLVPFVGVAAAGTLLPVSNGRFLQSAGYIPAALLSVRAIALLYRGKPIRIPYAKLLAIYVGLVFIYGLPAWHGSITRQMGYVERNMNNPLVMVDKETMDAFGYLETHASDGDILFAYPPVATLAPAFTPVRVLVGHPTFTYDESSGYANLAAVYGPTKPQVKETTLSRFGRPYVWLEMPGDGELAATLANLGFSNIYANGRITLMRRTE